MTQSPEDTRTVLEVFRLSAEACGYEVQGSFSGDGEQFCDICPDPEIVDKWNPFTDDSQRWECVEKLLEIGDIWLYKSGKHAWFSKAEDGPVSIRAESVDADILPCPAKEFPARALAALGDKS